MKLRQITEGDTELLVPENSLTKKAPVFYNPEMELNRDLSLVIAEIMKPKEFGDLMAASGARGIRIANELKLDVLLNDLNPKACQLIKKNAQLNDVEVEVTRKDANQLLSQRRFDGVDLDPFGSPADYVDSGFKSVSEKGILAVTATDTALFSGTYPKPCQRRYDARPLRTTYYNELGLRIFLGFLVRAGMRHDKYCKILFSHQTQHYYRTYLQVEESREKANKMLDNIKYIQHCFNCLNREVKPLGELKKTCECGSKFRNAGPLWAGDFAQREICEDMLEILEDKKFPSKEKEKKIVQRIKEEQGINVPYYNIHKVFKKLNIPARPMEEVKEKISENHKFARSHFSPLGIRTNAKIFDLYQLWEE